jgi:hypothetical protein
MELSTKPETNCSVDTAQIRRTSRKEDRKVGSVPAELVDHNGFVLPSHPRRHAPVG